MQVLQRITIDSGFNGWTLIAVNLGDQWEIYAHAGGASSHITTIDGCWEINRVAEWSRAALVRWFAHQKIVPTARPVRTLASQDAPAWAHGRCGGVD